MWLSRLDARAHRWPAPVRGIYLAAKWYLVALGGFALARLYLDRLDIWPLY